MTIHAEEINQLAGSGALKAYSLVCRAWAFRSRSYLFEICHLCPSKILGFCDLLRSPDCTFLPHICSIKATRNGWHENDQWFDESAADLGRLTSVRAFDLSLTIVNTGDAATANASFRLGFVAAFPNITRLDLACNSAGQPVPLVEMICLFPALQELHILGMSGILADPPADAVPPQGLRSLELRGHCVTVVPILAWLHAFNHLPNVHSVTLPCLEDDHLVLIVQAALQQLGGALHHLEIDVTELSTGEDIRRLFFRTHLTSDSRV